MIASCVNSNRIVVPIFDPVLTLAGLAGDLIKSVTGKGFIDSGAIHKLRASLKVDSSKIKQTLKWAPPQTIEEGIRAMVKAQNEHST
jgi:dTDP-D-glucose 4,6-dehydratase